MSLLRLIIAIVLALWIIGLLAHIGGSLIHTLLVIVIVIALFDYLTGRRAV